MILTKLVYDQLLNCSKVPPEIGGILGSRDKIVNKVIFDKGISTANDCVYIPNVYQLNQLILQWSKMKITFSGMFHTHADQWSAFSMDEISIVLIYLISSIENADH